MLPIQRTAQHVWENMPSVTEWVQVARALASIKEEVGVSFWLQSQAGGYSLNPQGCMKEASRPVGRGLNGGWERKKYGNRGRQVFCKILLSGREKGVGGCKMKGGLSLCVEVGEESTYILKEQSTTLRKRGGGTDQGVRCLSTGNKWDVRSQWKGEL